MGKSEQELQTLLNITARFASEWNLKFNSKKSKVMVIDKKIYKLKLWDLGNDQIEEEHAYKYLGVYFSRSLKFTYHNYCRNIHKGKCPEKNKLYDTNVGRTR